MTKMVSVLVVMLAANVLSSIGVVSAKHDARTLRNQLQNMRVKHDKLKTEYAQLQLEVSTWASPGRVSHIARHKLDMHQPRDAVVVRSNR